MRVNWIAAAIALVPASLVMVSFLLVYWGWQILAAAHASANWPSVSGTIIKSEVVEHDPNRRRRNNAFDSDEQPVTYSFDIRYQYTVAGKQYENDIVYFGQDSDSGRVHSEETVTELPVGTAAPVYYDPKNPSESCLRPGAYGAAYGFLLGGVVTLFMTAYLTWGWRKEFVGGGEKTSLHSAYQSGNDSSDAS